MTRYSGLVGYGQQVEVEPGVWDTEDKEVMMKGDLLRQNANIQDSGINDKVSLNHRVSLIGDAYAFDNYYNMKWVTVNGFKWTVSAIELQRPRLIVTLGGIWNGK